MYKIKEFLDVLENFAPLKLSQIMIDAGDYDNSGIIINHHEKVEKVLFSLDLTVSAVNEAIRLNCDTIVTHHPAIYNPIKSLDVSGESRAVLVAAANGINVISMHLNLDVADSGIDECLSQGLGVNTARILDFIDEKHGYGRETEIPPVSVSEFIESVKETFDTDKVLFYGDGVINKIASFCGGGASHAADAVVKNLTDADTIVTSDMPHHVLLSLLERGKKVMILPHYVAENYGFNKFYERVTEIIKGNVSAYYFTDKRFM